MNVPLGVSLLSRRTPIINDGELRATWRAMDRPNEKWNGMRRSAGLFAREIHKPIGQQVALGLSRAIAT
jgi:hypothetical protein